MSEKILLGMSGGVDSSVSAILLKQEGYEVIGCTMRLWEEDGTKNNAITDAKKVCEKLGIVHHVLEYEEKFKCSVIDNFISEYKNARTPNPCIECNKNMKFGYFYKNAKELGCKYIATGHYASIEYSKKYDQKVLKKSREEKKDQTYFLYTIPKEELEDIIFPLQNYASKQNTRKIAQEKGLEIAKKKDSQEICFIPDNNYQSFLRQYGQLKTQKGNIVLKDNKILGKHTGLINYTIGQRKGLGITYKEPLYVLKLDKEKNQVIVGVEKDLYSKELIADNLNFLVSEKHINTKFECYAKIRYRAKESKATVYIEDGKAKVIFEEEQRAITKGQSVVFYDKEGVVLGGGKIIA